jgi:hypothetical protein
MPADDKSVENPLLWKGLNLLGFAIMEVRDQIIGRGGPQNMQYRFWVSQEAL